MSDTKLKDEAGRISALHRYEVLDTKPEAPFDKITILVKTIIDVPICVISLVDSDRQWFKSCIGLNASETPRDISFCTHAILSRQPMVVPNAALDLRFMNNPLVTGAPFIMSYAGVPLETPDGYNIGTLCVIDVKPREFDPQQISILKSFADLVVDELELRRIAKTDHLTGALSRGAFMADIETSIAIFLRNGRLYSVITFDIDHFKNINDTFGHPAGDSVLRAVGSCCSALLRAGDSFGRIGGEEFAIILADAGPTEAMTIAERFRQALADLAVAHDPPLRLTASFGIASLDLRSLTNDRWLARADTALYDAKRAGRNRCCIGPSELEAAVA